MVSYSSDIDHHYLPDLYIYSIWDGFLLQNQAGYHLDKKPSISS